jgi:hypothetical protein
MFSCVILPDQSNKTILNMIKLILTTYWYVIFHVVPQYWDKLLILRS